MMQNSNISYIFIFILLTIWEIGARMVDKSFILPTPTDIVWTLWELKEALLLHHLPITLSVVAIGLSISIVLGISLAISLNIFKSFVKMFYLLLILFIMFIIIVHYILFFFCFF